MKHIILFLLIPFFGFSQGGTWPVKYGDSDPSGAPSAAGTRLYFNTATNTLFTWEPAPSSTWRKQPKAFDQVSGCAAPAYTPTARQSTFAVNSCTPKPELYQWTGSAWSLMNPETLYTEGTGIDITGGVITNTAPDQTVTMTDGTGIDVTGAYPNFTVTNTAPNVVQTLSIAGQDLTLSNGGGTVVIPGQSIVLDNYRLQGITERIPARGLSANESVTNYGFASVNPTYYRFNTLAQGASSTEYGGWLANGASGDSIAVRAPYCVIIGDSQAEGHPNAHGRLHPAGVATFTATTPDVFGTISYKLRALTHMRWFNHGIGGQTTTQVWTRWSRDVLAQSFDPGDGRGSRTLAAGTKPVTVIVIAGINDPYSSISTATTIGNLENMARSARDNGIAAVFLNCPGDTIITQAQLRAVDTLNTYFKSGALQALGASVVDYNTWWKQGSAWQDNSHKGRWITDDIHPSAAGYDTLATYIFQAARLPVLDSIIVYNEIGPGAFTGFSRPTGITLDTRSYTIPNTSVGAFKVNYALSLDSIFIKITSSTNVSGTTYSGFSHILFKVANDTTGLTTRRQAYQAYQGGNATPWSRSGSTLTPTAVTDKVTIGTTANPNGSYLHVKGPLNTGNNVFTVAGSSNNNILTVLDNSRVVVNSGSLGNYQFAVNGSMYLQNTSATQYNFFSGSSWEMFGSPLWRMQSTAVNTGGAGYTEMRHQFQGSEYTIFPPNTTPGADFDYRIRNKADTWNFNIKLAQKQVSIGNVTPNASSIVDITSTVGGVLLPRMTTAQRDAIASPATGLTLYCTDCTATDTSTGVMQTYNGATWKNNW